MRMSRLSLALAVLIACSGSVPAAFAAAYDRPACFDGIDNDNDGRVDYPQDLDCQSIDDTSEWPDTGVFVSITDGKDTTAQNGTLVYQIRLRQEREAVKLVNVSVMLPPQLGITYVSDDGSQISGAAAWRNVAVFPGNERTLYVHAVVSPAAQPGLLLVARAVADNTTATDTTMIQKSATLLYTQNMLKVSVTDNQDRVMPNQVLTYLVTVENPESTPALFHVRVPVPQALFIGATSPTSERIGGEVVWRDQYLQPKQTKVYTLTATVNGMVPNAYPIQLVAKAGGSVGYDRSTVGNGQLTQTILFSGITDGRAIAARGEVLTYSISINNASNWVEAGSFIDAAVPQYTEFVYATEGGYWDGRNVRWPGTVVARGGSRVLQFAVRVRSDAPDGSLLRATSYVQGKLSRDETRVSGGFVASPSMPYYAYGYHNAAPAQPLRVKKSASSGEVQAGGSIDFTVSVENTTPDPIPGVVVEDTFDGSQVWVDNTSGASVNGNTIAWIIDVLRPGEIRSFSYTAHVSDSLVRGTSLFNQARAYSDIGRIAAAPVPNAVTTVEVSLPRTGANDAFFAPVEHSDSFLSPMQLQQRSYGWIAIIAVLAGLCGLSYGLMRMR
jgi:uncharacterized repeat protein (TIGR01451 family)